MHKIDTATAVDGEFVSGSSSTGQQATKLNADWFNTVQRELVNLLEKNGVTLSKKNDQQLYDLFYKVLKGVFNSVKVRGNLEIENIDGSSGNLIVDGNADIVGDVAIAGAVNGEVLFNDNVGFESRISVSGDTLVSKIQCSGGITVSDGGIYIKAGNMVNTGTLTNLGNVGINGVLTLIGSASLAGGLSVSGLLNLLGSTRPSVAFSSSKTSEQFEDSDFNGSSRLRCLIMMTYDGNLSWNLYLHAQPLAGRIITIQTARQNDVSANKGIWVNDNSSGSSKQLCYVPVGMRRTFVGNGTSWELDDWAM